MGMAAIVVAVALGGVAVGGAGRKPPGSARRQSWQNWWRRHKRSALRTRKRLWNRGKGWLRHERWPAFLRGRQWRPKVAATEGGGAGSGRARHSKEGARGGSKRQGVCASWAKGRVSHARGKDKEERLGGLKGARRTRKQGRKKAGRGPGWAGKEGVRRRHDVGVAAARVVGDADGGHGGKKGEDRREAKWRGGQGMSSGPRLRHEGKRRHTAAVRAALGVSGLGEARAQAERRSWNKEEGEGRGPRRVGVLLRLLVGVGGIRLGWRGTRIGEAANPGPIHRGGGIVKRGRGWRKMDRSWAW